MYLNDIIPQLRTSEGKLISFRDGRRVELTFRELFPLVQQAAQRLHAHGLDARHPVGILARNDLDRVVADLACVWCGIKLLPIESWTDVAYYANQGFPLAAVLVGQGTAPPDAAVQEYGVPTIAITTLLNGDADIGPGPPPHLYAAEEVFSYKSTSGSTGVPKVMGHSVASVQHSIQSVQQLFQHSPSDRILVFLPLDLLQQRYWLYSAIVYQFTVIIVPRHYVFMAIKQEKPTVIMGIPYVYECIRTEFLQLLTTDAALQLAYERFLTEPSDGGFLPFTSYLGGHIRYLWTGSAPISPAVVEFYFQLGIPLYQGYGMNETCIIAKNFPGHNKTGSVGQLFPGITLRFGTEGQLFVKNQYPVCTHYTLPAGTEASTFTADGYVATGDIGYLDAEGYLYITGRLKDMIALSNSKKVYPAGIEEKLRSFEAIQHCLVYGDDRPFLTALIVPSSPTIPEETIRAIINDYNRSSKEEAMIYRFFIVYDVPDALFSSQYKIRRQQVYETYAPSFTALYEH